MRVSSVLIKGCSSLHFKNGKEGSKIIYRGDWAKEERAVMEANGYKNGDDLSGKNVFNFI